ncbi:MAG: hypothetical protein OJJ21_15945 [Ferrovibrio sp.]|uniref:hypothetical protein n=1 Tax=Ferrovibrio sp. TaxID=1917215 RepID=UPI00262FA656|nr:hypothetical protein [Ferrovibrio sp.]MCW0235094.1 hypothetical protein [Ferrovibrio sp.]
MSLIDIAIATIPGMILLLAIGIGGDALSRVVKTMATNRYDLPRLTAATESARRVYQEAAGLLANRNKDLQAVESQYLGVFREIQALRNAEEALQDPQNNTVFEIGRPAADASGWYVRVLLRRKHGMFNGLGTISSGSEGYRMGRLVLWGVDGDTARQLCRQRFNKEASVLSIMPFRGRLKRADV